MNWLKENKFFAKFGIICLVLLILCIVLLVMLGSKYNTETTKFKRNSSKVNQLRSKELFPDEENTQKKKAQLTDYKSIVNSLEKNIRLKYQRDLRNISELDFHNKLKKKSTEIQEKALESGVQLKKFFFMGMERYRDAIPTSDASPLLDFQLDALDFISKISIKSGVDYFVIDRKILDIENKAKNKNNIKINELVEILPFSLKIVSSQLSLMQLMNEIAFSEDFFFLIKLVKIENEEKISPIKNASLNTSNNNNSTNTDNSESTAIASFTNSSIVFGDEKLYTHLDIDLLKFNFKEEKDDL